MAERQAKAEVCLEVTEAENGEEGGEGDGEDAGAAPHHGSPGFGAILSLDAFSFLHTVNVGSGLAYQGEILGGNSLDQGTLA